MNKIIISIAIIFLLCFSSLASAGNWSGTWDFNYTEQNSPPEIPPNNETIPPEVPTEPQYEPLYDSAYGTITAGIVSSYEYDATDGFTDGLDTACRVNNSEYYLSVASGTGDDGFITSLRVYNSNGTILPAIVSEYEYDGSQGYAACIKHIPGTDKYVVAFRGAAERITVSTFTVLDTTGVITAGAVDTQQLVGTGYYLYLLQVTANVWAVAYYESATTNGFIETLWIDITGIINNTLLDIEEFDEVYANRPYMCLVDSDTIAITYVNASATGDFGLMTYNITVGGIITNDPADYWAFDASPNVYSCINKVGTNIFDITYIDANFDVLTKTVTIANTGMITKSWIDTLTVVDGSADVSRPETFVVHNPQTSADGSGILGVTITGIAAVENDGYMYTWNVSNAGVLDAAIISSYEFEATYSMAYAHAMYVNKSWYAIVYTITGNDGNIVTVTILTNFASPTVTLNSPTNGSTIAAFTTANITINDENGDNMNINWWSNSSGSWLPFGSNNTVGNGTYFMSNSNFSAPGTTYWWRTDVTDGIHNTSNINYFTLLATSSTTITFHTPAADGSSNFSGNFTMDVHETDNDSIDWTNYTFYRNNSVEVTSNQTTISAFQTASTTYVNVTNLTCNMTNLHQLNQSWFVVWTSTVNGTKDMTADFAFWLDNERVFNMTRDLSTTNKAFTMQYVINASTTNHTISCQVKTDTGTVIFGNSTILVWSTHDKNSTLPSNHSIVRAPITTSSTTYVNMTGTSMNITLTYASTIFIMQTFNCYIDGGATTYLAVTVNINGSDLTPSIRNFYLRSRWVSRVFFYVSPVLQPGTYEIIGRWHTDTGQTLHAMNIYTSAIKAQDTSGNSFVGNATTIPTTTTTSGTFVNVSTSEVNITLAQEGYIFAFASFGTDVTVNNKNVYIGISINNATYSVITRGHDSASKNGSVGISVRTNTRLSKGTYPVKLVWRTDTGSGNTATITDGMLAVFPSVTSVEKYEEYPVCDSFATNQTSPGKTYYNWTDDITTTGADWEDGNYRLKVYVNDTTNSNTTSSVFFHMNKNAPVVTILAPSDYTSIPNSKTVSFQYTVTSGVNITETALEVNNVYVMSNSTPVLKNITQYLNYTFASYGNYTWNIHANDSDYRSAEAGLYRHLELYEYLGTFTPYWTNLTFGTQLYVTQSYGPTVSVNGSTEVEETNATLFGVLLNNQTLNTTFWFEWNKQNQDFSAPEGNFTAAIGEPQGTNISYNATPLQNGTFYYFRAVANNSLGWNTSSNMYFLTKPQPAVGLTATEVGGGFSINWTHGDGYNVSILINNSDHWPLNTGDGDPVYVGANSWSSHIGLSPGDRQYYRVWEYSNWSTPDLYQFSKENISLGPVYYQGQQPVFKCPTPANASTYISIATTQWNITIESPRGKSFNWTIESPLGNNGSTLDTNGSKFTTITGNLSESVTYTVWVNATETVNNNWTNETFYFSTYALNFTSYSNLIFSSFLNVTGNEPIITDVVPTNTSTAVYMYPWLNVTVVEPQAQNFNISWYSNYTGSWLPFAWNATCTTGNTYRQRVLWANTSATTYYWGVKINDTDGYWTNASYYFTLDSYTWGNWSDWWQFNYTCCSPTNLNAVAYNKTIINLTWTMCSNGADTNVLVRNASGYAGYPINNSNGTEIYNGTLVSYNDTGLAQSTTYYYTIWGWNATTKNYSIINESASTSTLGDFYAISPYPANTSTGIARPPTNLSISLYGTGINEWIYYYNMTPATNVTSLLVNYTGNNTGRFEFTSLSSGTRFIWGNTTYYWFVNLTDGITWFNYSYQYTTTGSRYDVDNSGDVTVSDLTVTWNNRASYDKIYDVDYSGDITVSDLTRIWQNH